jgi:ABC-2 type transport system permease protein
VTLATERAVAPDVSASAFAGTGALLRLLLRPDRVRLPAATLAIVLVVLAVAGSWDRLYPTPESRLGLGRTLDLDPALSALLGPLFDPLGNGALTAWRTLAGALLCLGLVVALAVVRHTRTDEQEGRAEMVLAGAVGRAARVSAALGVAALYCVGVIALCALGLASLGMSFAGSLAYGAALGLNGFVFAGVAALTAQVARSSRAASGLAGLVLGAGFVLTAYGNSRAGGSPLVWASPFGWAEQARAFADERWGLLLVPAATAAVLAALAVAVSVRRDLGASLLAARPGRVAAAGWVRGPVGLAWRLDRGWLVWWVVATAAMGVLVGLVLISSLDVVAANPQLAALIEELGGTGRLSDAFIVVMAGIYALSAAGYGIATVLRLRSEETSGRAENVWTTPASRARWLAGHTSTALVGATVLIAVGGLSMGAAYGATTGAWAHDAWVSMLAALVAAPAAWLLVALPVALIGVHPSWAATLGWSLLGWCVLVGWFGAVLGLPEWLWHLAPTGHVPPWPAQPMRWLPEIALTAATLVLLAVGLVGVRRRDLPR